MKKRAWGTSVACLVAVTAVFVACSDDETTPGATAPDSGTFTQPETGTTTPPTTGGEEDAGLITDAGGNPDDPDDAGTAFDGGLPDGGTCGPASGNGEVFASTCVSTLTRYGGGAIKAASYDLIGFAVEGTERQCAVFTPQNYTGRLDVTATPTGFRFAERIAPARSLRATIRAVAITQATNNSLSAVVECGVATNSPWPYTTRVEAGSGKQILTYTHSSGTATVRFTWRER